VAFFRPERISAWKSSTPTTSFTDTAYSSGFVALYSNSSQTFGNVVVSTPASQRSMVDSIVYTFNQAVNLGANAITITALGQGGIVPTVAYASPDGGVTWVVTFSGNGVIGNSIANGEYQIVLNNFAVSAVSGGGTLASSDTESFYRLYGDLTGAQSVTGVDVNAFNRAYGNNSNAAGFVAALDYNDDGRYTGIDVNAFNRAFNTRYTGFTPTI
jgi:hypothetical protein